MKSKVVWLFLISLLLVLLAPFIGGLHIPLTAVVAPGPLHEIFWQLRLPRVLLGFVCGALLGLCGLLSQSLFRNSLASPDVLGISSGAAAGAALGAHIPLPVWLLGIGSGYLFGFAGALLSVLLILAVARLLRSMSVYTLLMTGIALNVFFSALVVLVQYLFDISNSFSLLRWLMGGIAVSGYSEALVLGTLLLLFVFAIFFLESELTLLSGGDDFAAARGLHVEKFRRLLLIVLALVNGGTVAVTGPIGFVSLIVPHMARLLRGGTFRRTALYTFFLGGSLLTLADLFARTLFSPAELPVGLITSFIGAPFFLFLLTARLRETDG